MMENDDTFTVFLMDPADARAERLERALAALRGVTRLDIRVGLAERWGVLDENLDEGAAEELVAFLEKNNVPARAVPNDDVLRFPPPVRVGAAKPVGEGFAWRIDDEIEDGPPRTWVEVPWSSLIYMAWAMVNEVREVDPGGPLPLTRRRPVGEDPRFLAHNVKLTFNKPGRFTKNQYLDLFAIHPARHLRIEPEQFVYAGVLGKLKPTAHLNLVTLALKLRQAAPRMMNDLSIDDLVDGDPLTSLELPSADAYAYYLLWHIQMAFGESAD